MRWLDDPSTGRAPAPVGAKLARLSELAGAGLRVPHGFVIGVDAYREHCARAGLDVLIDDVLAGTADHHAASRTIRDAFRRTPLCSGLAAEIADAYGGLAARCSELNLPVAVRSSATGEDSGTVSFAGVFDTYLGVAGTSRLLAAVRGCWASLFTPRALAYRAARGIAHRDMPMAVGVLELVRSRASGVAFSAHPVTGRTDRMVIEGSWGWGEAVVQGRVTPDRVEIGTSDLRVLRYEVATKDVMSAFDYAAGRVTESPVPERLRQARALDDEQLRAVAAAVRTAAEHCGHPVDVEWALPLEHRQGDPVYVLQCRPVTVSAPRDPMPAEWDPVEFAMRYVLRSRESPPGVPE